MVKSLYPSLVSTVDSTYKEPSYKELLLKKNNLSSPSLCANVFPLLQQTNSCYKELVTVASDFQMRFEVDFVLLEIWKYTGLSKNNTRN